MKPIHWVWIVWILLVMTGCAQYRLIEPKRHTLADTYSVEPHISWSSKKERSKIEVWTIDGTLLQRIIFVSGLEVGETLLPAREGRETKELPKFKSHMNASEVMELLVDSFRGAGRVRIEAKHLRPARFGTASGYRFEYTCLAENGLEMEGFAIGTLLNDRLFLIVYEGTSQHYFNKHKADVEKLIESIRLL